MTEWGVREDTIERIERVLKLTHKKSITVTIPRLTAERAVSMLKERETGWISVKDRLPDGQYPVLVYVPPYTDENDEYAGYVGMAYYTSFGKKGFWGGTDGAVYGAIGIIHEPTHWMPLPDRPRERR